LELVLDLDPSFEEAEKERAQVEEKIRTKIEDKGKQHALREATEEPRT